MFKEGDKITELSLGGASYRSEKVMIENNIASISPGIKSYIFEAFFQVLIWGVYLFNTRIALQDQGDDILTFIIFISIFCLSFSLIIRFIFCRIRKYHYFDSTLGIYHKGKVLKPDSSINLCEISVLHLIRKRVYSNSNSFQCFELSFCTKSGERVLLMNHGDMDWIRSDADKLANFLNVPCEHLKKGDIYGD